MLCICYEVFFFFQFIVYNWYCIFDYWWLFYTCRIMTNFPWDNEFRVQWDENKWYTLLSDVIKYFERSMNYVVNSGFKCKPKMEYLFINSSLVKSSVFLWIFINTVENMLSLQCCSFSKGIHTCYSVRLFTLLINIYCESKYTTQMIL